MPKYFGHNVEQSAAGGAAGSEHREPYREVFEHFRHCEVCCTSAGEDCFQLLMILKGEGVRLDGTPWNRTGPA